jgi:uncharacterized membrane protein YfcA
MIERAHQLKLALGLELGALAVLVVGCLWVTQSKLYTALSFVALISLVLCGTGLVYSLKEARQRQDRASTVAVMGSAALLLATLVIGFMGYAAGV